MEPQIPNLTSEDVEKLHSVDVSTPEGQELIKSMGLGVDQGLVEIQVDGKLEKINTDAHDFGTLVVEKE
ncbi:MAG: hypothetical protein QF747_01930 [Patescibacteria group bacterium]|nr:hypothetical protein [Patescibacteria group bacterium]